MKQITSDMIAWTVWGRRQGDHFDYDYDFGCELNSCKEMSGGSEAQRPVGGPH